MLSCLICEDAAGKKVITQIFESHFNYKEIKETKCVGENRVAKMAQKLAFLNDKK